MISNTLSRVSIRRPRRRAGALTLWLAAGFLILASVPVAAQVPDQAATALEVAPGDTPVREDRRALDIVTEPGVEVPNAVGQFTTAVENREPVDQVTFVSSETPSIIFYSDLRGLEGQTVLHRWIFAGETMAEVPFEVGGPRWRVWSSKDLLPVWVGDWTVEIVDGAGEVIAAETFTYSAPGDGA